MSAKQEAGTGERREFRMHKNLLWSVVQSQAGTLSKAILEGVMNSVDAGASFCRIEITRDTLKIVDDGKGFTSRKEIEDFFEQFGTPHQEGDATFGFYRMGRGQLMSFCTNRWRSGNFLMDVNIRDNGLEYDLHTLPEYVAGCEIDCALYDKLEASALIRLIDELRELCKYAPIKVLVNKERISKDLSSIKWTDEDENAYYLIRDSARAMEVFNLGVLVRSYWSGEFGTTGIVVSKKQLKVNFARNDVLVQKCEVFKAISQKLRSYAKKEASKKPKNNEAFRQMMMEKMMTGAFDTLGEFVEAVREAKVITDYSGKHFSLEGLLHQVRGRGGSLVAAEEHSIKADKVQQGRLALVVDPKTMQRARNLSLPEILTRIESNLSTFMQGNPRAATYMLETFERLQAAIVDLEVVGALIDESMKIIEPEQYTKEERLLLGVLQRLSYQFYGATGSRGERKLGIMESESYDGVTDGKKMVLLNRKFMQIGGSAGAVFKAFDALKSLLLHEYLHDSDDSSGHGHPAEFYERFHDILANDQRTQWFVYEAARLYLAARRKAGARMRAGDLHSLDVLLIEDIGNIEGITEAEWNEAKASIDSTATERSAVEEEPSLELAN